MAGPAERMMTTDPSPGKPAWTPKARSRYPQVTIKKGWEPPNVGAGQGRVGVGASMNFLGGPPDPYQDPALGAYGGSPQPPQAPMGPFDQGPQGYPGGAMVGGPPAPYSPFQYGGGNVNPPAPQNPPYGQTQPAGQNPAGQPRGGGGAPQQPGRSLGGQPRETAPRGPGSPGGPSGGGSPSPDEMQAVGRFAAAQWGVSFEQAMQELMAGAPEAQQYLQAALGMLRAGDPAILGMLGGGAPGMPDTSNARPISELPPDAVQDMPLPPSNVSGPAGAQGNPNASGQPYWHPNDQGQQTGAPTRRDYSNFYQGNDVMRQASQFGTPVNAMDMPGQPGVTVVTYADGTSRPFNADGTFFSAPNKWGM